MDGSLFSLLSIHTHTVQPPPATTHHPPSLLSPLRRQRPAISFHRRRTLHRPSTRQYGAIGPSCILLCFSASLAPPTDAPAIILIRLPQRLPTQFILRIRRPTIPLCFSAHRPPATAAAALPCRLSLPASRLPLPAVVHKHSLAAPPTTVSAAAARRPHTILAVSR